MSRPIEATPTVTGRDAEELLKEIDTPLVLSLEKQKELDKCHALYIKFSNRKFDAKS